MVNLKTTNSNHFMLHEQTQLNHSYVICSECGKMRPRKKSVFGHFSLSNIILHNAMSQRANFLRFQQKSEFEKWCTMRTNVCGVVTYLCECRACVSGMVAWVACYRGCRSSLGYVLACVALVG